MANLIFKKGSYADFKAKVTTAQEGAFYLTEDEGGLYVGLADGSTKRIQGSLIMCDDLDDLVAKAGMPPYDPNVIYFDAKDNALFRYNGTDSWIQLNQTAEATTTALNALSTRITDVSNSLKEYKTSNDAAVALKASKQELQDEIDRATAAETANAEAAAKAQSAAADAQTTADNAKASAGANATIIADHGTRLDAVEILAASKTTMAEVEAKDYATQTDLSDAKKALIGTSSDDSSKNTIYGVKTLANAAKTVAEEAMPKAGGTFTGNVTVQTGASITLTDGPSDDLHAANKAYVDNEVKKANSVSTGLDGRLTQAEKDILANATAAANAKSAADAAQTTADNGVTNAAKAQSAADAAAAAAKSANDNANIRVLQEDYDADKEALDGKIAANTTSITALNTELTNYKQSNDSVVGNKLDTSVAEATYATKTELASEKSALLGTASDTSAQYTIYGAQKGVEEAKEVASDAAAAAKGAQTTADNAVAKAQANETAISDEVSRAKAAEEALTEEVQTKATQSALEAEISRAKDEESRIDGLVGVAQTTADNALPLSGSKAMTGALNMGTHKITNLAEPSEAADAVTKKYVDDLAAAADAMKFMGVLGISGDNGVAELPTSGTECGWTYMVGAPGNYGLADGVTARIGDLIINVAADGAAPKWVHVEAGYQSDYLQKLSTVSSSGDVTVNLSNGVDSIDSSVTFAKANNVEWSISEGKVNAAIVWGTF